MRCSRGRSCRELRYWPWMLVMLLSWTAVATAQDRAGAQPDTPTVRVVYLVPSDRETQSEYHAAIADAIANVQGWYHHELGGQTFLLRAAKRAVLVETYVTAHVASWYATNPNGCDVSVQFWCNALGEGFTLTGGGFNDPLHIWVFYIDADPACGQLTGGTSGVALLPANDLRGLVGQPHQPTCPGESPDPAGICRWVGGLAHELGHAFGLPHPAGCEDSDSATVCPSDALMWLGFRDYPETYLLPEDITLLTTDGYAHPFFRKRKPVVKYQDCPR
jgi:hypothetical protein